MGNRGSEADAKSCATDLSTETLKPDDVELRITFEGGGNDFDGGCRPASANEGKAAGRRIISFAAFVLQPEKLVG